MLEFKRKEDKNAKVSVAGRVPLIVKNSIDSVANKYNLTPSSVVCKILVAWQDGETFDKRNDSETKKLKAKVLKLERYIKSLEKDVSLKKEALGIFISEEVAEKGSEMAWVKIYNEVLKKLKDRK